MKGLRTEFRSGGSSFAAVDGISFSLAPGETLGIVGESGCGKSVTSLSIMRLVPNPPGRITAGEIKLDGRNLLDLPESDMRAVRGDDIAMIFQEPMTALNPLSPVGRQIAEMFVLHEGANWNEAMDRAEDALRQVRVPSPERRIKDYPHQLSGGMRQRVMIAIALACGPDLLVADEPTTALDVTVQAQVLALLKKLQADAGMAMIFITHDLGVVAETADRVVVMYAGRKVEEASVDDLFENPLHPYTVGLIGATPTPGAERAERLADIPGMVPPLNALPQGCAFAPRCPRVMDRCLTQKPALTAPAPGRLVACFAAERT
ncbi:ABC transporter ATP-binding protein [Reyranella sp.]|uniref:ABC transporter ATP-binding protein n=1 Tax=Reyranella sp. TaxID=1929291 RepID=UPI0026226378|nr:ABC transporter ATP-binding protein [Reyranella sp.]